MLPSKLICDRLGLYTDDSFAAVSASVSSLSRLFTFQAF